MKLLIIGHGRHGKDTVSEYLAREYGFSFDSSSHFAGEKVVYPAIKSKYGYRSFKECYDDRHRHRKEWFDIISAYNDKDPAALGKAIFKEHDIYCGLRNSREFHGLKNAGVVDYTIWVDRSKHLPLESRDSMELEPWMADFVIDNNRDLSNLHFNIRQLMNGRLSE